MAQPHGRSHASHTYDITKVVSIDSDTFTIVVETANRVEPTSLTFAYDGDAPVAAQLFGAIVDSLAISGKGGRWESLATLRNARTFWPLLLNALLVHKVRDLGDPNLSLQVLRSVVNDFTSSTKRTINHLLARALQAIGTEAARHTARRLLNTTHITEERAKLQAYSDLEVDAFEAGARHVYSSCVAAQRELMEALGIDVAGRKWMQIQAEPIIAAARDRDAARPHQLEDAPAPPASASRADHIDWCLLNPERCADEGRPSLPPHVQPVAVALYPRLNVLVAGLILLCLADNTGANLATMLRSEAEDLTLLGVNSGKVRDLKARNHSQTERGVTFESIYSQGGVRETMTALTRFARHHRRIHLADDEGNVHEVADRLFVRFRADPTTSQILTTTEQHNGYRRDAQFRAGWETVLPDQDPDDVGLRWNALRHAALYRGLTFDANHDVVDHTPRTRVDYLAQCLPEVVLHELGAAAQDDLHERALQRFLDTDAAERLEGALTAGNNANVHVSECSSGGHDPDDTTTPCSLGLAACFTCPNGYRTRDHVPGLLALVKYTEIIRDADPDEWVTGDAAALHHYATDTLSRFQPAVVDRARSTMNMDEELLIVHGLYNEFRR